MEVEAEVEAEPNCFVAVVVVVLKPALHKVVIKNPYQVDKKNLKIST